MVKLSRSKFVILTILIVASLFVVLSASKKQQETRSNAQAATSLSFSPASSSVSPLSQTLGNNFSLDLMLNPGTNLVSLAKIEILYDPSRLTPSATNPVAVNSLVFPQLLEGPIYSAGKIQIVVSVGPDLTHAISQETKALTLNFKASGATDQTIVSMGGNTQIFSVAYQDASSENVLSTTTPAVIKIISSPTPTTASRLKKGSSGGKNGGGGKGH